MASFTVPEHYQQGIAVLLISVSIISLKYVSKESECEST